MKVQLVMRSLFDGKSDSHEKGENTVPTYARNRPDGIMLYPLNVLKECQAAHDPSSRGDHVKIFPSKLRDQQWKWFFWQGARPLSLFLKIGQSITLGTGLHMDSTLLLLLVCLLTCFCNELIRVSRTLEGERSLVLPTLLYWHMGDRWWESTRRGIEPDSLSHLSDMDEDGVKSHCHW